MYPCDSVTVNPSSGGGELNPQFIITIGTGKLLESIPLPKDFASNCYNHHNRFNLEILTHPLSVSG